MSLIVQFFLFMNHDSFYYFFFVLYLLVKFAENTKEMKDSCKYYKDVVKFDNFLHPGVFKNPTPMIGVVDKTNNQYSLFCFACKTN